MEQTKDSLGIGLTAPGMQSRDIAPFREQTGPACASCIVTIATSVLSEVDSYMPVTRTDINPSSPSIATSGDNL